MHVLKPTIIVNENASEMDMKNSCEIQLLIIYGFILTILYGLTYCRDVHVYCIWIFYRIPRLKGFDTPAPSTADTSIPNPFADRPSTARQHAQAKSQLDAAIQDLDKISNIPEGVEEAVWQRLCAYRREKIENDLLVSYKLCLYRREKLK